jgi:hypothetical protein
VLIATSHALYDGAQATSLRRAAEAANEPGRFVALYGQEFSTISTGNHTNVFDAPHVIDIPNGRFDEMLAWGERNHDTTDAPPIVQLNHPAEYSGWKEYGRDRWASDDAWRNALNPRVSLLEVLNGPAMATVAAGKKRPAKVQQADYFDYLNRGLHVAPSSGQDNHYPTWGTVTDARVAIIAEELSKPALLQAIRDRHVYATEDRNLRILFTIDDHLSGDIVAMPYVRGGAVDIRLAITDDDEPNAAYKVEIFRDSTGGAPASSPIKTVTLHGDTSTPARVSGLSRAAAEEFFLVKITQNPGGHDQDRAWLAPIWFTDSR